MASATKVHRLSWPDSVLRQLARGPAEPKTFGSIDWEDVTALGVRRVSGCTDLFGYHAPSALDLLYNTTDVFSASACGSSVETGPNPNHLQAGWALRLPWALGYTLGLGTSPVPRNLMYRRPPFASRPARSTGCTSRATAR